MIGIDPGLEKSSLAHRLDPRAARRIDVVMRQRRQSRVGPAQQPFRKAAVAVIEERPAQGVIERHLNFLVWRVFPSPPLPPPPRARAFSPATKRDSVSISPPPRFAQNFPLPRP